MIRPTTWIAAAIAIATMSSAALADGKNEIRAVTYDEDAGMTRVLVRGAETPTFTVYKLERPSRVVLDIPRAKLADTLRGHEGASVWSPSTWAVSTIAAQQIDDGGQIVRVIVTLARPGRYDVKTEGNAVVLMMSARDPAPAKVSPEALEQAKRAAASAEQARASAQAEAERLRKAADAAQKALDDAKRSGHHANQAELARVKAEADKAKQAATAAQAEADRARIAAEKAQREAMADANRAREEARMAKQSAADSRAEAERAKQDASLTRAEAAKAKQDATQTRAEAERVKQQAAREAAEAERVKVQAARDAELAAKQRAEAERVKRQAAHEAELAAKQLADAERAKQTALRDAEAAKAAAAREAEAARQAAVREATAAKQQAAREAEAARQAAAREAEAARQDLARTKAEAEAARREVARAKADAAAAQAAAKKEMEAAAAAQAAAKKQIDAATSDAAMARNDAATAQRDAMSARTEAADAKAEAARARAEAEASKSAAAADRKVAEKARAEADKMLREAKQELATLDKKTQTIQALEDKARAANAAAQAREDQARAEVARAMKERAAAEAAAKQAAERAQVALKQSSSQSAALAAEAKAAEDRLAKARRATEEAESHRKTAETAASGAKKQLEQTRNMLTAMEQQRAQAETAANTAARKRGEAEAAASDAAQRRADAEAKRKQAEAAAQIAAQQKTEAERERFAAEQQRKAAEEAAREAKTAAEAAEKQRTVAEAAMRVASDKRKQAEVSLEELNMRRLAAEKAAQDLEARSKAEAKAKAEIAAAETRKAAAAEIEKLRTEAARLAKERTAAEAELADRRKAVAAQQAAATRAESAASAARDAASREETRRAQLAEQRATEEKELARIKAQRAAPPVVAQAPAPAPVAKPVSAPKGPASPMPGRQAKINDIRFHGSDGSALVDIAMTQDAAVTIGDVTATHAELIIDNAELAAKLERKLDVTKFGSPVKSVSSFRDRRTPNRVRLIAELAQPATPVFDRAQSGGKWKFVATKQIAQRPVQSVPPLHGSGRPEDRSPLLVAGFGATSTPVTQQTVSQLPAQGGRGRRVYRGATVDFDFKDAPMHDLLRLIADTGRVNIVIPDNIDPKVTVRLKRVPWDQALEVILASHGLWYRRDGNLYRIAPRKELDAEDEAEAARREAAVKSEAPKSRVVPLNYADAGELRGKLEPMLSPKGRIETDPRTNSLIIVDVAGNREEIERLAVGLDTQTPQISIEARIVEARSTFVRQFGIQWGGRATASAAGGNATGLNFPSSVDFRGANEDGQTNNSGIVAPSDFAVNMPAATGTGEGGAVGLSLGSIGGNFAINLRLSALEDTGTIRIISAPKITVLNNRAARISQGVSIPISVISASGTNTQFVQADLALEVTPHVAQGDCSISMNLTVTKNEPDFVNTGARGDPTILRKEAKTSMIVADGETSVLGGIYTRNSGLAYKKVPFFADIPVLGWFFKNRRENDDRTEILVFITPKITNRGLLRCQ